MTVEPPIAFDPAELDCRAHHLERQARVPKFLANGEALDLGEIGEEADAQTARRLIADVAEQMRRREIVSVEFLFIRTFLLADIDRASQTRDPHEILEGPRHRDCDGSVSGIVAVRVVERRAGGARKRVKVRSVNRPDLGARPESERLKKADAIRRDGACIEVHACVIRRVQFPQNGRNASRQNARRIDRPDVDAGWPLVGTGEQRKIGVLGVERVCRKLIQSALIEEQKRDKSLAGRRGGIELTLALDRPYRVLVVPPDAADYGIGSEARDAGARLVGQGVQALFVLLKDHQMLGKTR